MINKFSPQTIGSCSSGKDLVLYKRLGVQSDYLIEHQNNKNLPFEKKKLSIKCLQKQKQCATSNFYENMQWLKDLMLIAFQELNDILHRQVSNVHESWWYKRT